MAGKRYKQRKSSMVAKAVTVGCASLVLAGFIGFGVASAGNQSAVEGAFGLDADIAAATADQRSIVVSGSNGAVEDSVLESTSQRDISQNVQAIEEQLEAERKAAEELARAQEAERIAAAEAAKAVQQQSDAAAQLAGLSDVDWSVGEEAFIAEWTARIDAYLAGSPLAGQGATFARAAWNNGVDPRWSPAISNTESSKGAHCFLPCNAWGWGSSSWGSWEEAINAHVAGLASGYGYSITYAAAQKYCPPNCDHWFNATLSEMMSM